MTPNAFVSLHAFLRDFYLVTEAMRCGSFKQRAYNWPVKLAPIELGIHPTGHVPTSEARTCWQKQDESYTLVREGATVAKRSALTFARMAGSLSTRTNAASTKIWGPISLRSIIRSLVRAIRTADV